MPQDTYTDGPAVAPETPVPEFDSESAEGNTVEEEAPASNPNTYRAINANAVLHVQTGTVIPLPAGESEGFKYEAWLAEGNEPEPAPEPPPPAIPNVVTMRQARLALLGAGKLQLVEAAIESLPEPPRTAAKIEWEYSQEVHRNKSFVQMLAQGLGLTETELDQLFTVAATL